MAKKLLIIVIVIGLFTLTFGCSQGENSVIPETRLMHSENDIIDKSDEERVIGLIQNYTSGSGTIKDKWDEIAGDTGTQEWQAFRPAGYSSHEVYCVELAFNKSVDGNEYNIVIQWLLNLEEGTMRDFYYEVNDSASDKLSVEAIIKHIHANQ